MAEIHVSINTEDETLAAISRDILDYLKGRPERPGEKTEPPRRQTVVVDDEKKKEAVRLLKSGVDARTAAAKLGLSPCTVRAYKAHITMGTY